MAQAQKNPQLRIIGGRWRSRHLPIITDTGVRPTSDRIRETLFNWLQGDIINARCLDLFAGSGALGFEALSRGAAHATLVDEDIRVVQQLQKNVLSLDTKEAKIIWQQDHEFLAKPPELPFDIVFLDPPFRDDLLGLCCEQLERPGWLNKSALIYLESEHCRDFPELLPRWRIKQDKRAGRVAYRLLQRISDR